MLVSWKNLLVTYPLVIGILAISFFTGHVLSVVCSGKKAANGNHESNVFFKLFLGLFFIVSIYAILKTNFQTSLLPIPLLVILVSWWRGNKTLVTGNQIQATDNKKIILLIVAGSLLFWLYFALHFLLAPASHTAFIKGDALFYGRAAHYLNDTGIENVTIDYTGLNGKFIEPYHYGDLWSIAFVEKLTGLNPALLTTLVVYPLFAGIFIIGLYSYIRSKINVPVKNVALAILALAFFVSGFYFLFPSFIFSYSENLNFNLASFPKMLLPAFCIIANLMSLEKKDWTLTWVLTAFSSLLFINIAPGLVTAMGALFIFQLVRKKEAGWKIPWIGLVGFFLVILYYVLFYKLNKTPVAVESLASPQATIIFNTFIAYLFKTLPYFPFIILGYFIHRNNGKKVIKTKLTPDELYFILLPISAAVFASVGYFISPESTQFFHNILTPVSVIFILYVVIKGLSSSQKLTRILSLCLFTLAILVNLKPSWEKETISKSDISVTNDFIRKHGRGMFVNLRPISHFDNWFSRNTMAMQPLPYITYLYPQYFNPSLNSTSLVIDSTLIFASYEKSTMNSAPFSIYSMTRQDSTDLSLGFIRDHKARYLAIPADTSLPASWRHIVKDSVLLNNNWQIYYIGE